MLYFIENEWLNLMNEIILDIIYFIYNMFMITSLFLDLRIFFEQ